MKIPAYALALLALLALVALSPTGGTAVAGETFLPVPDAPVCLPLPEGRLPVPDAVTVPPAVVEAIAAAPVGAPSACGPNGCPRPGLYPAASVSAPLPGPAYYSAAAPAAAVADYQPMPSGRACNCPGNPAAASYAPPVYSASVCEAATYSVRPQRGGLLARLFGGGKRGGRCR